MRPHSALGHMTPVQLTGGLASPVLGGQSTGDRAREERMRFTPGGGLKGLAGHLRLVLRRVDPCATAPVAQGLPVRDDSTRGAVDAKVEHIHSDPWILIGDPSIMGAALGAER